MKKRIFTGGLKPVAAVVVALMVAFTMMPCAAFAQTGGTASAGATVSASDDGGITTLASAKQLKGKTFKLYQLKDNGTMYTDLNAIGCPAKNNYLKFTSTTKVNVAVKIGNNSAQVFKGQSYKVSGSKITITLSDGSKLNCKISGKKITLSIKNNLGQPRTFYYKR